MDNWAGGSGRADAFYSSCGFWLGLHWAPLESLLTLRVGMGLVN